MSKTDITNIEVEFEIGTTQPIDPRALASELAEVIETECPEISDFWVQVRIEK